MSGLGRKEFNSGDILLASEVQGYLQDQAVMVFDDATARGSAIPSPSEGMVTYDKATDTLEFFDGSSFVPVVPTPPAPTGGGLVHITTSTFTSATSAPVNNCFSATYDNYLVTIVLTGGLSSSGNFSLRMRNAGTDNTTAEYYNSIAGTNTSANANNIGNPIQTSFSLGSHGAGAWSNFYFDAIVKRPFTTNSTIWGARLSYLGSTLLGGGAGTYLHNVFSSFDGFNFICSQNVSGIIRVYGLVNS